MFGKLLNLLGKIQCALGSSYVVVNGQILSEHFSHLVTLGLSTDRCDLTSKDCDVAEGFSFDRW